MPQGLKSNWTNRIAAKDGLIYLLQRIRSDSIPWLKLAWQDLKADCKRTRWLRGFAWFLLFCLFGGLVSVLALTPVIGYGSDSDGCSPDGTFNMDGDYDVWRPSNLFEVTLRSGNYNFGAVKIIDVVWDVVVGRGGQALLAYITYNVMTKFLTFQMTLAPVALPVYKRVFMEPELGLRSTFCLLWDFFRYRPLASPLGMLWIILTSIFIAIFPTWTSAMTSYTPSISPFVKNAAQFLVPYDSAIQAISYVIRDGDRLANLNLTKDYVFPQMFDDWHLERYVNDCDDDRLSFTNEMRSMCNLLNATSQYVKVHGFRGLSNATSTFMNITLDPPTLNIDAGYLRTPPESFVFGYNWVVPNTRETPFAYPVNQLYLFGDAVVNKTYLNENGRCQPANDTFQWGFSFLLLFILTLLLVLWGLGSYLIYLQSHFALRYVELTDEVAGEYAATFRLTAALREEFQAIGQFPDQLTEAEIKHTLRYTLNGGTIEQATKKKDDVTVRELRIAHMDARLNEHKWWILTWVLTTAAGITITVLAGGGPAGFLFGIVLCSTAFGITISGFMGCKPRSRHLFVMIWTLIGFIVGISLAVEASVRCERMYMRFNTFRCLAPYDE